MSPVEEFAQITRNVIAHKGFDEFNPTTLYPTRRHIAALEGVPPDAEVEAIALEWAADIAVGDEEFLVAFKIGPTQFKVIRRHEGTYEAAVVDVREPDGAGTKDQGPGTDQGLRTDQEPSTKDSGPDR